MSINCEQFIYTADKIGSKKGYQIISKSNTIDENILNSLTNYLYPIGVNVSTFNKSKSMIVIDKTHVAYSIIKNIGYGNDGRFGTLYNHTFLMHINEFKKLNNDSRIFDDYFIDNNMSHENLKSLNIKSKNIGIDFKYLNDLDIDFLNYAISLLLKKYKIAISNNLDENLIQNLLSILPPNLRLIEFSSHVVHPDKQPKYNIMQIRQPFNIQLKKNCIMLDQNFIKQNRLKKNDIVVQLIHAIHNKDNKQIKMIHNEFININEKDKKTDDYEFKKLIYDGDKIILSEVIKNIYLNNNFNNYSITNTVDFIIKFRKIIDPLLITYENNNNQNELIALTSIIKTFIDYLSHIEKYKNNDMKNILSKKIHQEIKINNVILKRHKSILQIIKNNERIKSDYLNKITNIFLNCDLTINDHKSNSSIT